MSEKGLIHIYTGDGKGKTTAAIGLAMRAKGAGLKVIVAQLFKQDSSEASMIKELKIEHLQYSSKHPLFKKYSDAELKKEAAGCTTFVKGVFDKAKEQGYDFVVLDEIGPALKFELLNPDELADFIRSRPENTELIMTGRGFPSDIIKLADYVTEMTMIKHPFNAGVKARTGIEY